MPDSSEEEQHAVNVLVAGSIPAQAANGDDMEDEFISDELAKSIVDDVCHSQSLSGRNVSPYAKELLIAICKEALKIINQERMNGDIIH